MGKRNQYLYFFVFSVSLLVTLVWGGNNALAIKTDSENNASDTTESLTISIDYDSQQMVLTSYKDKEIRVCFPTVKEAVQDGKSVIKSIKEKNWDYYTNTYDNAYKVTVSLASVNPSKVTYVEVAGDYNTTPMLVCFDAAAAKLKTKYTPAEDYDSQPEVSVTASAGDIDEDALQFRTLQGRWRNFAGVNLNYFTQQGTDIYVRAKAVKVDTEDGVLSSSSKVKVDETTYTLYSAGSFAGTEAKLKIRKKSNAPTVQVKYSKDGFVVKQGIEYRFRSADGTYDSWNTAEEKFLERPSDGLAGALEVRTVAEEGKTLSKVGLYEFDANPAVTLSETAEKDTGILSNTTLDTETSVELQAYVEKGVVKLTNQSSHEYNLFVSADYVTDTKTISGWRTSKPTATIKAGKTLSLKSYTGKYLYVRYAASDKAKTWQSEYVLLGKIVAEE